MCQPFRTSACTTAALGTHAHAQNGGERGPGHGAKNEDGATTTHRDGPPNRATDEAAQHDEGRREGFDVICFELVEVEEVFLLGFVVGTRGNGRERRWWCHHGTHNRRAVLNGQSLLKHSILSETTGQSA